MTLTDEVQKKIAARGSEDIWNDPVQLKDIVLSLLMLCTNKTHAQAWVKHAYNDLSAPARQDTYGRVLAQIEKELVNSTLVLSGWEAEEPERPIMRQRPIMRHGQNFQLIPYIKDRIRFMEMEFYKANDAETEETLEVILNPMMSDLIVDEGFLEEAIKEFITKDIGFRFDVCHGNILNATRKDLQEEMESEECWEYLAELIKRFV